MAESSSDFLSSMRGLIRSEMIDMNTSIDGVVIDYAGGFATVRPVGNKVIDDQSQPFPVIYKVPVRWPSFNGGQCGFKGPVTAGDKVQIIFGQQAADGTDDGRRFDLTDAYAIPCDNSAAAGGANNSDVIMWFGGAYIKLTAAGACEINAPAGMKVITPNAEFTAMVKINGMLTFLGGITGSALSGAAAIITGTINFIGALTSNGKNISDTHTHGGVQTGGGTSGPVS